MKLELPWKNKSFSFIQSSESNDTIENERMRAGQVLAERRKELGLSRIELSKKTLISTSVIESIENDWIYKLPEKAYLSSMLTILEKELKLESGSLKEIIKSKDQRFKERGVQNFMATTIEVFSTWQGGFLYIFLMLASVLLLNFQQKRISINNSKTINPIAPNLELVENKNLNSISNKKGKLNNKLANKAFWPTKFIQRYRLLKIILSKEVSLQINSKDLKELRLNNTQGEIEVYLKPPVLIKAYPPLSSDDLIIWEGKSYKPRGGNSGVYRLYELFKNSNPSLKERPQNLPLTP